MTPSLVRLTKERVQAWSTILQTLAALAAFSVRIRDRLLPWSRFAFLLIVAALRSAPKYRSAAIFRTFRRSRSPRINHRAPPRGNGAGVLGLARFLIAMAFGATSIETLRIASRSSGQRRDSFARASRTSKPAAATFDDGAYQTGGRRGCPQAKGGAATPRRNGLARQGERV
jgi:hypothetical protein